MCGSELGYYYVALRPNFNRRFSFGFMTLCDPNAALETLKVN